MAEDAPVAAMEVEPAAQLAENGNGQAGVTGPAADSTEAAAEPAASSKPADDQQEPEGAETSTPRHKERSSRRDHKSSRDDPDRKSRHKDRDGDRDRRKDEKKSSRKRGSRSRSRSRDRKSRKTDERGKSSEGSRHRSRHRSSSRERRRSRRSRSRSRSKDRSKRRSGSHSRHRSRSRRHRSPSPVKRHGRQSPSDSEEGVGGYVPRKRQEPPREGVWSLAAAGFSTSYIDPYGAMRSHQKPLSPEEIRRQMLEQQLKARQMVLAQQASSAVAAASKTQREVYIGNLVGGMVTEDALRQLFNNTMAAAFPEQMVASLDPVVNVSMHSEGRYAFVELRTPEMASAALQLSGQVQLLGQPISVGRPSGYVDPSAAQAAAETAKKAFDAFQRGEITLEEAAAAGNAPAPGADASASPSGAAASPGAAAGDAAAASPGVGKSPLGAAPGPPPTPYLAVSGMVTAEVLADDTEYEEVIEDLQEECGKYGTVIKVAVPRPPDPANAKAAFGYGNYGKAFVQFGDENHAKVARDAIHGRLFAGVTVEVTFISAQDFTVAAS